MRSTSQQAVDRAWVAVRLAAVVLPLLILLFSEVSTVDDAYIGFRHSHNLWHGRGPVFNVGERVEGYTNLLWTFLMVVPIAVGLPVHLFATAAGLGFALLSTVAVWRLCRRLEAPRWSAALALLLLALYPGLWLVACNGLEGGLFAFLLMGTLASALGARRPAWAGVWGGLLMMTRPEAAVVVPICAIYELLCSREGSIGLSRVGLRRSVRMLTPWLVVLCAVTSWRLVYYGAWLPNSVMAKRIPLGDPWVVVGNLKDGVRYVAGFAGTAFPLVFGALLALLFAARDPRIWVCAAVVGAEIAVAVLQGGDWMPGFRLLAVYSPVLAVLAGVGVARAAGPTPCPIEEGELSDARARCRSLRVGVFGVLALATLWNLARHDGDVTPDLDVAQWTEYIQLAEKLEPALTRDDKVSPEALGTLSYKLPDVYVHDFAGGLTDHHIARHGTFARQWGRRDYAYSYGVVRPTLFVLHEPTHLDTFVQASDGHFTEQYHVYGLRFDGKGPRRYPLLVAIRKDAEARLLPTLRTLNPRKVSEPFRKQR